MIFTTASGKKQVKNNKDEHYHNLEIWKSIENIVIFMHII